MSDKTNFGQSLTHMIKGNLGAGILSMPRSFANLGLVSGLLALPLLCVVSAYCVHALIKSSRRVGKRLQVDELNYSILARRSFELGPGWLSNFSHALGRLVDTALLVTQIGVCCVYIVFVVDNVTSIMASYHVHVSQPVTFMAILPVTLALSFIRTLSRLAIASLLANLLQALGLMLIIEYLLRDMAHCDSLQGRDNFRPLNEMALGFGSVMFAFEGISVVLPIYNRINKREQFGSLCGVVNVSFLVILALYMIVGLLGYLRYGAQVKDSITLNLPAEPLYDAVRAMFTISILLTYPLQFYVPNEIIWDWARRNVLSPPRLEVALRTALDESAGPHELGRASAKSLTLTLAAGDKPARASRAPPPSALDAARLNDDLVGPGRGRATNVPQGPSEKYTPKPDAHGLDLRSDSARPGAVVAAAAAAPPPAAAATTTTTTTNSTKATSNYGSKIDLVSNIETGSSTDCSSLDERPAARYEYLCRVLVVLLTFTLAFSVPKLNLLMDLIGSFSGVLLCLVIPCLIHMASYWDKLRGLRKASMVTLDCSIVVLGLAAGVGGSLSSLNQIIKGDH